MLLQNWSMAVFTTEELLIEARKLPQFHHRADWHKVSLTSLKRLSEEASKSSHARNPRLQDPCLAGDGKCSGRTEERKRTTNTRTLLASHTGLSGLNSQLRSSLPSGEAGARHPPAIRPRAGAAATPGAEGRRPPPGRAKPGAEEGSPRRPVAPRVT